MAEPKKKERQVGVVRRTLPPAPPDDDPFEAGYASKMHDPLFDVPVAEGRQQLVIHAMKLVKAWDRGPKDTPRNLPTEGILAGKRLLIKAQGLESGPNGKRRVAVQFFWPIRGRGAEDGSALLTTLDHFLERVLGRIPRPGTFPLSELIGLNFMATVQHGRGRVKDELHPCAYYQITTPDCCPVYDDWPKYKPHYSSRDRGLIFVPEELSEVLI